MSSFFTFKRPQVPSKRSRDASAGSRPQVLSDKENSLFVFGYACKIFDDKEKALHYDQGKHLIPWPGDESLKIDRYDARLYFTSESQFVSKPDYEEKLSAKEAEEERLCDEERYMELSQDMTEFEIEQEEEMKRFQEVMSEDGYYSSVSFSYEANSEQNEQQFEENATVLEDNPNTMGPAIHQPVYWNSAADNENTAQEETQENNEYEVFVPPPELEIPSEMEIPQTKKMHSIIAKTAMFLSKHGAQMEIVVKAKQSGNPQFDFLSFGNWLNPYYRRVLSFIKEGKFIPETEQASATSPTPDKSEVAESESDEDSDGDYDLHPLLTASLHRKPVKPSIQPLPMQPLPSSFKPTFTPEMTEKIKEQNKETHHAPWQEKNDDSQHLSWSLHEAISGAGDTSYTSSMPYPVSSIYDPYSMYMNMSYVTTPIGISATQTAASMLPPPPPPPGEGPPEELGDATSSGDILPLPPPPPPPVLPLCPPMLIDQEIGAVFPTSSGANLIAESAAPVVPPVIVPPPPDLQPIVDKLAMYVARNGEDFESTVKAKNDARFDFLNPWNAHYSYYHYKKQLCLQQLKKKNKSNDDTDPSTESPKGPISFSLKTKDMKKPKIEYRTNVVYKQSVGESDDEEEEDGDEGEENVASQEESRNKAADNGVGDQTAEKELTEEERNIQEQQNLENQMNSIAAAQREAKRLEMESLRSGKTDGDEEVGLLRNEADQERQIQLERRRRASLFISMLKNTTGNGVQETVSSADEKRLQEATSTTKVRTFSEIKRKNENRIDQPETKKVRSSSPIFDIDESSPSGVGAPPPDSIKLTQDLMVKVLAARNKR